MRVRRFVIAVAGALGVSMLMAPGAQAGDSQTGKSTLDQTIRITGSGFKKLVAGPGESYRVRTGIGRPGKHRAHRRTSLLFFGQLTDPQLADEMSPTRLEPVDPASGAISAAWRPQETLDARVFDSIVKNMDANKISAVPDKHGRVGRLGFTILTGDIADSAQYNEVNWFRDLLNGKVVTPYSGQKISAANPCPGATQAQINQMNSEVQHRTYVGVQDFSDWPGQNQRYSGFWDPDLGQTNNRYGYGHFPRYPGLVDKAQSPINTRGLDTPWYITRGNHDSLVQGNVPANLSILGFDIGKLATGCLKPWPNNLLNPDLLIGVPSEDVFAKLSKPPLVDGVIYGLLHMRKVAPDPNRRYVSKYEFKQLMGRPDKYHGFGYVNAGENHASRGNATYYGFNKGKFRIIMLDTNAEGGGAAGNLDDPQYQWLKHQLDKFSSVHITKAGKVRHDGDKDKLMIISSHHTIGTMDNPTPDEAAGTCDDPMTPGCDSDPRNSRPIHMGRTGKRPLLDLLLSYPNVVAYVNGHTHHNAITAYKRNRNAAFKGGFWQINTSSHVDFPQQSREIQFFDNHDGTLSIFGTLLNSAAPITSPKPGTSAANLSNAQLASLSRRLAANDPQFRYVTDGGGTGRRIDRNVEMIVKDPRKLWITR